MAVFNKLNAAKVMFLATLTTWAVTEMPLEECREKAAAGDAEAQYQLGQRYEEGRGLSRNGIRAVIQYKKAAEQKHRKACKRLSELHSRGEFVKKDSAIAAKYRALASGDNAEIAIAKASEEESKSTDTVDDIEVALDWILGRNGKRKDPKIGIRMLCDAAKDRPIAKGVFIKRWMKGDLDDALEVLTDEEWTLIESWFEEAFRLGGSWKKCGLILGNKAFRNKHYTAAISFYQAAGRVGVPKAWYFLGCLYWTGSNKEKWGTPDHVKSDRNAMDAFIQTLKINPRHVDAKWNLGLIYLFSDDKQCRNYKKAHDIFSELYRNGGANNKWILYDYGLSGLLITEEMISNVLKEYGRIKDPHYYARGRIDYDVVVRRTQRTKSELEAKHKSLLKEEKRYLQYIKQAADMGCEPAQKLVEKIQSSYD